MTVSSEFLRAAVGFRLAEADIGQLALDQVDDAGVHRRGGVGGRAVVGIGERDQAGVLALQRTQNVVQALLDPSEVGGGRGGAIVVGRFQPLQQVGHALFDMGKRRRIVGANRDTVEPFRQRAHRIFEQFRLPVGFRRRPCFQRRGQRGQALLELVPGVAVAVEAGKLIDLGRQRVHVVGEPGQRVVGGDVGDDAAQCRDRAFELLHGRRIVVRTQDQIELGAEIADRLVVAGELLGRRQRAQHLADFAERLLDAGQSLAVAAVLAVFVDAAGQRADLVLERFDFAARHRLGDGLTDFGEFAAERRDRFLDMVGTLQRLDLAGDLEQVPLERRKIRTGRCRGRGRRRGLAKRLARWTIKFVLARDDLGDRKIHRGRAERRRGAIDLGGGALDHVGLTLLFLHMGLPGRRGV